MNNADLMSSAYASYAQNLASYSGSLENHNLIDQLQSLLKSNGVQAHSSGALQRKLSTEQSMDSSSDRDGDGVRPSCRFCGKTFAQASYIKAHERLHTGEKPYVCSVCNKAFSDASNWKKHERMHSRQIQSVFEDGVVSAVTSAPATPEPMTPNSPTMASVTSLPVMTTGTLSGLSAGPLGISSFMNQLPPHLQGLQTPTSLGGISAMSAMFPEVSSSLSLLTHGAMAHQSQPSAPPVSQMSQNSEDSSDLSPPAPKRSNSSSSNNLAALVNGNTGSNMMNKDETLDCNICGKSFSTPASLSMHKKIHSGEKPHTCGTCGKSFTQIGTLRAHERVHTGEKPYECGQCGKTFAQCGSFRMHERRHHRDMLENFQKCFVCGASFSSIEELQKHLMCHPGALNLNLPGLHPGALGFSGAPLPLGFGFPPDLDGSKNEISKRDLSEMTEMEKAFSLFAGQPKTAPITTLGEHFHLPPFASTAHALIQRSLSQGNDPNTAVSMLLASSNTPENLSLLGGGFPGPRLLSPTTRLPLVTPDRSQSVAPSNDANRPEEVEPVSTTTRSRKYSSDSHTSMQDGNQTPDGKRQKGAEHEDNDNENDGDIEQENDGTSHRQKAPSEDSSLAESRSMEDFQSDDQQQNGNGVSGTGLGISRRNLNKRMISSSSSSNSRKQRRPMRRFSSSAIIDAALYQQQYNNNNSADGTEGDEELTKDQLMVSFLLSKGEVYKCEHCHIIFEDCTLYLLHNGFHANDRDPFKCVICKKSCDGRMDFNCHLTSHIK